MKTTRRYLRLARTRGSAALPGDAAGDSRDQYGCAIAIAQDDAFGVDAHNVEVADFAARFDEASVDQRDVAIGTSQDQVDRQRVGLVRAVADHRLVD